jgi:hypothetical protein
MLQSSARHPLSVEAPPLSEEVLEALWQIFVHIGKFWQNMDDPEPMKSQVYNFVVNRVRLRPIYQEYYISAQKLMSQMIAEYGEDKAYEILFTDQDALKKPPETPLAVVRQKVANELVAWQLAVGGFKAWGATNYCSYIGGANIPGQPTPYRTFEE